MIVRVLRLDWLFCDLWCWFGFCNSVVKFLSDECVSFVCYILVAADLLVYLL